MIIEFAMGGPAAAQRAALIKALVQACECHLHRMHVATFKRPNFTCAGSMPEMSSVGRSTAFKRCTIAAASPGLDVSALHSMWAVVPAAYLQK